MRGQGGANLISCPTITIDFVPPLPATSSVSVGVDGANPEVLATGSTCEGFGACVQLQGDSQERRSVVLRLSTGNDPFSFVPDYPASVTISVGMGADSKTLEFSPLAYSCVAQSVDDWCWKTEPLTFNTAP
ncbi:MAG: hypothetical protein SFV15_03195 [Polyangiaceae bacterium]|nr:hypothetical protein [Polyangiaceae bacterium]